MTIKTKSNSVIQLSMILLTLTGCSKNEEQIKISKAIEQAAEEIPEKTVCRLILQDHETGKIKWADVLKSDKLKLSSLNEIKGFPNLDSSRQNLVQMKRINEKILVGVRDDSDGTYESGYILFSSGVEQEPHGDHSHWNYENQPEVLKTKLDKKQGNPAHLYQYENCFYLANDKKNGFTRINPKSFQSSPSESIEEGFHSGGGNHITIAVAGKTAYSTWIDRKGPDAGRIDVLPVTEKGNQNISYSLKLKTGAIHGATTVEDKVFFAPSEGIAWVMADQTSEKKKKEDETKIQYIDLGKDPDEKPLRTGAFHVCTNHVLFVSGKGSYASLNILDGKKDSPELTQLKLSMKEINSPTTPMTVRTINGKRLAFIFHNHLSEIEGPEFLSVVNLDPDNDQDFTDAKIEKEIAIGPSKVEGHYGHHEITFDESGRYAFWTNPGEGIITMFSLQKMEKVADFPVGEMPTKIIAHGDMDHDH